MIAAAAMVMVDARGGYDRMFFYSKMYNRTNSYVKLYAYLGFRLSGFENPPLAPPWFLVVEKMVENIPDISTIYRNFNRCCKTYRGIRDVTIWLNISSSRGYC